MADFLVVAAIPTRGAVLTDVIQAVEANFLSIEKYQKNSRFTFVTTSQHTLPASHNEAIRRAQKLYPAYVWLVEEDTVPPPLVLSVMLDLMVRNKADVMFVDYRLEGGAHSLMLKKGEIFHSGIGCMLISNGALTVIGDPWFDGEDWILLEDGTYAKRSNKMPCRLDVGFLKRIREEKLKMGYVQGIPARHLRLEKLGERGTNNGLHTIREL